MKFGPHPAILTGHLAPKTRLADGQLAVVLHSIDISSLSAKYLSGFTYNCTMYDELCRLGSGPCLSFVRYRGA